MKLSEEMRALAGEGFCLHDYKQRLEEWAERVVKLEQALMKIEKQAYGPVPERSTRDRVLTKIERLAKRALDEAEEVEQKKEVHDARGLEEQGQGRAG